MGKSRKSYRGKKSVTKQNRISSSINLDSAQNVNDSGSLYTDIISIDDNKRLKSCRILSNWLLTYSHETFEKIVKHDILSRLVMRIADHNSDVKYEALGAIRNLVSGI